MFEDSTFESQGRITTSSRRWSLAAFALNGAVLSALIIFPLMHPEAIPHRIVDIALAPPAAPHEAPALKVQTRATVLQGRSELTAIGLQVPRVIPDSVYRGPVSESGAPVVPITGINLDGSRGGIPWGDVFGRTQAQTVRLKPKGPVAISQGVAAGLIVHKAMPVYPPIARAAGVQGTVVLHAIISRDGSIDQLRVESGPAVLQQAALDAVAQWRYRPFLLNGAPVDVETTINVVFSLGR